MKTKVLFFCLSFFILKSSVYSQTPISDWVSYKEGVGNIETRAIAADYFFGIRDYAPGMGIIPFTRIRNNRGSGQSSVSKSWPLNKSPFLIVWIKSSTNLLRKIRE